MASTVSPARSTTASAHSTLAPSRANRIAVAWPLPMTLPLEPAPVTIATLPASLAVMRGILPGWADSGLYFIVINAIAPSERIDDGERGGCHRPSRGRCG